VLTPTTRPLESSSGPPELPGLTAASVWITLEISRPALVGRQMEGADHPRRQRLVKTERITDRISELADLEIRRTTDRDAQADHAKVKAGRGSARLTLHPAKPRSPSHPCCRATQASSPLPRHSATAPAATSSAAASSTAVSKSP
jgi:hypothetical protein